MGLQSPTGQSTSRSASLTIPKRRRVSGGKLKSDGAGPHSFDVAVNVHVPPAPDDELADDVLPDDEPPLEDAPDDEPPDEDVEEDDTPDDVEPLDDEPPDDEPPYGPVLDAEQATSINFASSNFGSGPSDSACRIPPSSLVKPYKFPNAAFKAPCSFAVFST